MSKQRKYIFITGGVLSSIGKGIAAASIGMLMEQRGIQVTLIKMDPYLNVDPGTMNPIQHGEVFVLDDGTETDLDLGHYSRFVQKAHFTRKNSFTTGRIYDAVIRRERAGAYEGKTVQVIPHITDEIKRLIHDACEAFDLVIVEVGGTVGDIESLPFLETIRQMRVEEGWENVMFIHLTLVPYVAAAGELKTKPTQHSVRELREIGIQPDLLLCRSDRNLPMEVKEKIGLFCNVSKDEVFSAVDVSSIYEVPLAFHAEGLDEKITQRLGIWSARPNLSQWENMVEKIRHPAGEVVIGVVGKYTEWRDSYKSLAEALVHGGCANDLKVIHVYIDAEEIESKGVQECFRGVDGILVPGGFGGRGIEGKIQAIAYAREEKVPFFGLCLGMQLAVVEFARHVCGLQEASSAEFVPGGASNVIEYLPAKEPDVSATSGVGGGDGLGRGGMRLGSYDFQVLPAIHGAPTHAYQAYRAERVSERHRHRFAVASAFRAQLEAKGLRVSGFYQETGAGGGGSTLSPASSIVEIIELADGHPWFLGCQFHPEFLSQPLKPHPLFAAFIQAAAGFSRGRKQ